jgi:hypothetical protein
MGIPQFVGFGGGHYRQATGNEEGGRPEQVRPPLPRFVLFDRQAVDECHPRAEVEQKCAGELDQRRPPVVALDA